MTWEFLLLDLAKGAITTLTVSTAGIGLGMLAGLFLALVHVGRVPIAAQTVAAYTSLACAARWSRSRFWFSSDCRVLALPCRRRSRRS